MSMIDILKLRGCFFTGVAGLEVESEFHTCANEVTAGFTTERQVVDVLDNGNLSLLELGVGDYSDSRLGIDLAAISEIRRSVDTSEEIFAKRHTISQAKAKDRRMFGFGKRKADSRLNRKEVQFFSIQEESMVSETSADKEMAIADMMGTNEQINAKGSSGIFLGLNRSTSGKLQ